MIFFTKILFISTKSLIIDLKVKAEYNYSADAHFVCVNLSWLTPIFIAPSLPFDKMCFNRVLEIFFQNIFHLETGFQTLLYLFTLSH